MRTDYFTWIEAFIYIYKPENIISPQEKKGNFFNVIHTQPEIMIKGRLIASHCLRLKNTNFHVHSLMVKGGVD